MGDQLAVNLDALKEFQREDDADDIGPVWHTTTDTILAFDQSLANTGWALISGGKVTEVGNIKTEDEATGHEGNLNRSLKVFAAVNQLIWRTAPDRIVHELPPVGSRMVRPESSLLSALAIWLAAYLDDLDVTMVGAQKAKKRWTGSARSSKAELKAALLELHPYLATLKPMNQAISDAIAVGLLSMELEDG